MDKIIKFVLAGVFLVIAAAVSWNFIGYVLPQQDYDLIAAESIEEEGYGEPVFYHLTSRKAVWTEGEGIVAEGKQDLFAVYEDDTYFVVDYFTARVSEFHGKSKLRGHELCRRWYFEKDSGKIQVQSGESRTETKTLLEGNAAAAQGVMWVYVTDLESRSFSFGLVSEEQYGSVQDAYEILFLQEADTEVFGEGTKFIMYCEEGKS